MGNYSFDASQGKKGRKKPARSWWGVGLITLTIVMAIVFYDFSDFSGNMKGYFSNRHEKGKKIGEGIKLVSSEQEDTEPGKDIVVTEKDLQGVYKDLLQKKEKEIEKVTILESEKGSCYQIDLITGRTLIAVTIQLDKKMAMITDRQGMVISIDRREIAGIKKIEAKANAWK
jgi:hypothetical protein